VKTLDQKKKTPGQIVQEQSKRTILYSESEHKIRSISEEENGMVIRKIRGYALLFDEIGSPWLGSTWKEKIDKTALTETKLSDSSLVLGKAGKNATFIVDEKGLFVEVVLGDTWIDDYVYDRVNREIMDGMSFWFDNKTVVSSDWENKVDTIVKINEIYEVSVLPFPAYQQTVVIAEEDKRSLEDEEEKEDLKQKSILNALLEYELEG